MGKDDLGLDDFMKSLEEASKKLEDVAKDLDDAVESVDEDDPHSANLIAEKLGIKLEDMLAPPEPLHDSIEEAAAEATTKKATNSLIIQNEIEKRIKDIIG